MTERQSSYDYCIIGSGIAGALVALNLLEHKNISILMLEVGRSVTEASTTATDAFGAYYDGLAEYENVGEYHYPLRGGRLWARGGTTLIWTGHAFRLKPEDFKMKSHTGLGVDWPISYHDLEGYYSQAEHSLFVSGNAADLGHPPRSSEFPVSPQPYGGSSFSVLRALSELGYGYQHNCISRVPAPQYTVSNSIPTEIGVVNNSEKPFSADRILNDLVKLPNFKLLTNVAARRLRFVKKSRAESLEVLDIENGVQQVIYADTFVICGGGIESAKLLLASAGPLWPGGVGNDYGYVGRFFVEHPYVTCLGSPGTHRSNFFEEVAANTACSRHFDDLWFQDQGKFILEIFNMRGYWTDKRAHTLSQLGFKLEKSEEVPHALAALVESVPRFENYVALGSSRTSLGLHTTTISYDIDARTHKSIENARERLSGVLKKIGCTTIFRAPTVSWARHHSGTCRMNDFPDAGVVDCNLLVHGTDNIYVCSSAVFPTAGAANPTLTVAALAHRLAQHL